MHRNHREWRLAIGSLVIAVASIVGAAGVAHASLYSWNPQLRPPVTLATAHAAALKSLGNRPSGFEFTGAVLFGSEKKQDASAGAWNLDFRDAKGRHYNFHLDLAGHSHWGEPYTPQTRSALATGIKSLDDVQRTIKASKFLPTDAQIVRTAKSLTLTSKLREFQVHAELRPGEYATETSTVVGPGAGGFRIHIEVRDRQPADTAASAPRYWHFDRQRYRGFHEREEVVVDWETDFSQEAQDTSLALASLVGERSYPSPESVSPAFAFEHALAAATAALGKDEPQFYCLGANYEHTPAPSWEIRFGAADGREQTIAVSSDKKTTVTQHLRPAFKLDRKIDSLAEAERLLPEFLKSQGLKAEHERRAGDALLISTATRTFALHYLLKDGYTTDMHEVEGPLPDGVRITVREQSRADFLKLAERYSSWGRFRASWKAIPILKPSHAPTARQPKTACWW